MKNPRQLTTIYLPREVRDDCRMRGIPYKTVFMRGYSTITQEKGLLQLIEELQKKIQRMSFNLEYQIKRANFLEQELKELKGVKKDE